MTPRTINANNEFNQGWLDYLLGEARPSDPIAADGWDMAEETPSIRFVAQVVGRMRQQGQIIVREAGE